MRDEPRNVLLLVMLPLGICAVLHYAAQWPVLEHAIRYAAWCVVVFAALLGGL